MDWISVLGRLMSLQVLTKEAQSSQLSYGNLCLQLRRAVGHRKEAIRQKWKCFQKVAKSSCEEHGAGDTWKSKQEAGSRSLFSSGQAQPETLSLGECSNSG